MYFIIPTNNIIIYDMNEFEDEVNRCYNLLKQGKIIIYPTDTIWGIGCDATNFRAVEKILKIKNRPSGKGLIILVDSYDKIKDYVKNIPPVTEDVIKSAKNPLSIIFSESKGLAKNISNNGSVCIRVTSNVFCQEVIRKLGRPITSTSANLSGETPPFIYNDISENMKKSVDYVVSFYQGVPTKPKPSTIIRLKEDNSFDVIRP